MQYIPIFGKCHVECGRQNNKPLKCPNTIPGIHILLPYMAKSQRVFADVIRDMHFEIGNYPGLSSWPNLITWILKSKNLLWLNLETDVTMKKGPRIEMVLALQMMEGEHNPKDAQTSRS